MVSSGLCAFECKDVDGQPVNGLSVVCLEGDGVGLVGRGRPLDKVPYELLFWRREDNGRNWQRPTVCSTAGLQPYMLQDTLVRTSCGRLILPVYFKLGQGSYRAEDAPFPGALYKGHFVSTDAHYFDPHFGGCYVYYSDDQGATWHTNDDGQLFVGLEYGSVFGAAYEPSVTEVAPGRLHMMMRTGLGRLFQAWSDDDGRTWSRPEATMLAADHSPAQIRSIRATGNLLCVWNQHSDDEIRRGLGRTRISAAVSRNGGGVWEFFANVESLHQSTRVEPGPVASVRPEELYNAPSPLPPRDPRYIQPLPDGFGRWSYPSVLVTSKHVLISHSYALYNDQGQRFSPGGNMRLKVLPLSWLYGGGNPQDANVELEKCSAPAP